MILNFLNSDFGIWLLSAIFLSGAGTLYRRWEKQRDEEKALLQKKADEEKVVFEKKVTANQINHEAISKIDVEISYRLSTVLLKLASLESLVDAKYEGESDNNKRLLDADLTLKTLQSMNLREHASDVSLYPEYSTYTFTTLLAELRRRLPEANRGQVEASIASYTSMLINMSFPPGSPPSRQTGVLLLKNVVLKRWQGTAFHFMNPSDGNPFC